MHTSGSHDIGIPHGHRLLFILEQLVSTRQWSYTESYLRTLKALFPELLLGFKVVAMIADRPSLFKALVLAGTRQIRSLNKNLNVHEIYIKTANPSRRAARDRALALFELLRQNGPATSTSFTTSARHSLHLNATLTL